MTTRRFTISNIILYVLLFGIIFYIQHIVVIDLDDPFRYFDLTETIVLFFLLMAVGAWYFIYEYKQRKLKLNFPLACILIAFFVTFVVITILFPEEIYIPVTYQTGEYEELSVSINADQKILFIFVDFAALFFIYIFLAVIPLRVHCTKQLNFVFYAFVILGIISVVYSLITEQEAYSTMFDSFEHLTLSTQSFTNNPNNFAMILMFGVIAALFLHHTTHGLWWFIPVVVFVALIIPTNCRTNLVSTGIIIFGYLVIRLVLGYKKHPYLNSLLLFSYIFIIGIFVLGYYFYMESGYVYNVKIFGKIHFMIEYLKMKDFNSRQILWDKVTAVLNEGYWVTGLGFGLFSGVIIQCFNNNPVAEMVTDSPHNGYYQTMGCGGYLLLAFLTIALLYLVWMMIRIFRRHKSLVLFTVFILAGFGFHLLTEAATPLIASTPIADCLAMTIFTFVPVYATYYNECHTSINQVMVEEAKTSYEKKIAFRKPFAIGQGMSLLGVLAFGVVASILPNFNYDTLWIIVAGALLAVALLLPLGIEALVQRKQFNIVNYLKEVFIPYIILAVCYGGFVIGLQVAVNASYLIRVSVMVATPFIYIGLFATIPYFARRTGFVVSIIDVITRTMERHLAKKMILSNKEDRPTLYEKWTKYITPLPFRNNYETRNNQSNQEVQ